MINKTLVNQILRDGYRKLIRPILFRYHGGDPEAVHDLMFSLLEKLPKISGSTKEPQLSIAGIQFPNRVGLAAGLDKDGRAAAAWKYLGFGFAELGTVTAKAQPGNDRPRLYRAIHSQAIINRMGFNNTGALTMANRLARYGVKRGNNALGIPIGISIGKTKTTALDDAQEDYLFSLRALANYADYLAINVSSPNTPGLRNLQHAKILRELINCLGNEAANIDAINPVPIFVKLAPDLADNEINELIAALNDSLLAGFIATNTTLSRDGLIGTDISLAQQAGGLSGKPLTHKSLSFVESLRQKTGLPIIASGGIMTPNDAKHMFEVGADLVQVYTGFIFEGPALVHGIKNLI